jgi:hypothetical protein
MRGHYFQPWLTGATDKFRTDASLAFAPSVSSADARRAATVIETEIYDEARSLVCLVICGRGPR